MLMGENTPQVPLREFKIAFVCSHILGLITFVTFLGCAYCHWQYNTKIVFVHIVTGTTIQNCIEESMQVLNGTSKIPKANLTLS